jgi:DNA-binding Lrp family transcriptional regulator
VILVERAFICVTTEPSSVEKVLKDIKAVKGVEQANMVFGAYDVCFSVKEENLDELKHVLDEKITNLNDVRATLTLFETGQGQFAKL